MDLLVQGSSPHEIIVTLLGTDRKGYGVRHGTQRQLRIDELVSLEMLYDLMLDLGSLVAVEEFHVCSLSFD